MQTAHLASRLWTKSMPDGIWRRVDDISKQFTGAGWKNLPQELVDEILDYILDDLKALKACSLTCKRLFGATRPLIHQRFMCLGSKPGGPKPIGRHKRDSGTFGRLTDADRSGVLCYIQHLTIKVEDGYVYPRDMQECLPHLRLIPKLHALTLDTFHLHLFIPVFDEHFGMFTNTLRHLDIQNTYGTARQLSYIICQFPLLEDLTIVSPAGGIVADHEHPIPTVIQSPPLRGRLVVSQVHSREFFDGLAKFPGGLNFRSLELHQCEHLEVILKTCGHTTTSISYLWRCGGFGTFPPDLRRCVVLKRFEFNVRLPDLWQLRGWIHETLRMITSTRFDEFVIWILDGAHLWSQQYPPSDVGWEDVDALLNILAERNPDFRVVFRGDFDSFRYGMEGENGTVRRLINDYLPLVSSKGLVGFEPVRQVENRFWKSGIL